MTNKFVENIDIIRCYIKNNIFNKANSFYENENERKHVCELLKKTVEFGESNSALLIGPRGSGKTTLVHNILQELHKNEQFLNNSLLVKLHGLVHTDDKLSLKSITSQMNLDNAVDGKVFGSFAENLAFLLACLKSGKKETSKSVIFILEEFDLFCNHHNQTLLYNLFDISQSAQAPICVLGITCRLDVIELLEKRVKSRFSHRQIFLFSGVDNGEHDFNAYLEKIKHLLYLHEVKSITLKTAIKNEWNKQISQLICNKKFKDLMERLWSIDTNQHTLKNILFSLVSKLNKNKPIILLDDFEEELNKYEQDELIYVLQDLSILELCLIIAMRHHCDIYDNQPMNFEMVYTRYLAFANANSSVQLAQRPVVMKAFEHIQNLELISMINAGGSRLQKEYQMFKLLVNKSQITEAIKIATGLPTEVVQWANSSLL